MTEMGANGFVHEGGTLSGAVALVTGGSGFIGRRLCSELAAHGAIVYSVGRRHFASTGHAKHLVQDLSDGPATEALIGDVRPDYVFHLASVVRGRPVLADVSPMLVANLLSTVNVLTACLRSPCRRVVIAGSLVEPELRRFTDAPSSPYAAAKWASADYARMYSTIFGLPAVIARIFMAYGPAQFDQSKLVPHSVMSALRGKAPSIASGTRAIDWIHVDDVVDGLMAIAVAKGLEGKTIDLGTGVAHPTLQVVRMICETAGTGVSPAVGALPDRPDEPSCVARTAETAAAIGWRARTTLEDGIPRTVEWYRQHLDEVATHGESR